MAGDVGEAVVTAVVAVGELFVIEPEHVEDGGVEVVDVDLILGDADAAVVGGAVDGATFDAGAGHPGRKRPVMVFPACLIGGFFERGASEFGGPHDQRIFEHASLFQVLQ